MTEVILELISSQREVLKNVEKTVKELDAKQREEVRMKLLEASNELCLENKSLKHEAVRRTMARVFGDDKCIGKRKNGRPCANKCFAGLDGYCKTCYKTKPPEGRVISFGEVSQETIRVDMSGAGTCVLAGAGSGGFPGTPVSRSPPPEDELRDLPPLY